MKERHYIKKAILILVVTVLCSAFLVATLLVKITIQKTTDEAGKNVKTIVWYTDTHSPLKDELLTCNNGSRIFSCRFYSRENPPEDPDAYIFQGMEIKRFPLPRNKRTIWGLVHDETPKLKPMFMHERALNLFNFSATFSRKSDVRMPLFSFRSLESIKSLKYFVNTSVKNSFLNEISPVVYFQSNCFTLTERDVYVKSLMNFIQIDSYGLCLHNKDLNVNVTLDINPCYDDEIMKILARYKFIIAIENAVCSDYVTEKFWRSIELGVVPIYYGSPLIMDWLPNNKSAILLEDFPTPELLSRHLHYLLKNDTAYEEYLEHKTLGIISNRRLIDEIGNRGYQNDLESIKNKFLCFICERLHDVEDTRTNMVTKQQYDCPVPRSALTTEVNLRNGWHKIIKDMKERVNQIYKELEDTNTTSRASNTNWECNY